MQSAFALLALSVIVLRTVFGAQTEHEAFRRASDRELSSLREELVRVESRHGVTITSMEQRHATELSSASQELAEVKHSAQMASQAAAVALDDLRFAHASELTRLSKEVEAGTARIRDLERQLADAESRLVDLAKRSREDSELQLAHLQRSHESVVRSWEDKLLLVTTRHSEVESQLKENHREEVRRLSSDHLVCTADMRSSLSLQVNALLRQVEEERQRSGSALESSTAERNSSNISWESRFASERQAHAEAVDALRAQVSEYVSLRVLHSYRVY